MHGALVEGKKKKAGIIFPMCPSQQLVPLIEEINNAEMGFCRELPFSALDFQISYLSLNFGKWENPPNLWCPSFPESFQSKNTWQKMEKKGQWPSLFFRQKFKCHPRNKDCHPLGISRDLELSVIFHTP